MKGWAGSRQADTAQPDPPSWAPGPSCPQGLSPIPLFVQAPWRHPPSALAS